MSSYSSSSGVPSGNLVTRKVDNFAGVDFSNSDTNLARSPDSLNMWKNYKNNSTGIETRPDMELVEEKNRKMMEYIRNALTSENVNSFAKDILQGKTAVSISSVFKDNPEILTKVIGLYTYSQTPEREYEIRLKDTFVECNGVRFKEFIVEERKG